MKRTTSLILLLLSAFSLATGAKAAPPEKHEAILTYSQPQLSLDDEKQLIFDSNAHRKAVWIWTAAVNEYKAAIFAAILEQDRINDARQAREERSGNPARGGEPSSGRCGGNLPPCYVMNRESGGSLTAENPVSTASGKWQFLDSTWAGYGGYSHASQAPESVQDARAAELWASGSGCSHWSAC